MNIIIENHVVPSVFLKREVIVDCYLPINHPSESDTSLLLINDGQDLPRMNFAGLLEGLNNSNQISPVFCVAIHCGPDRRSEYGTAHILDYKGRGVLAASYQRFIFEELLPYIHEIYSIRSFKEKSICGFSLGGLSAIDTAWNHPEEFCKVGIFSGSLWWRIVSQDDPKFDENEHRIMHSQIRSGSHYPWLKFFFETGTMDETADRNQNGVIDAIDDTVALINELVAKGYNPNEDIKYLELTDGHHDVETWGRAFPEFLVWGWRH